MTLIKADNATEACLRVFQAIREEGVYVGKTVDLLDVHIVLRDPRKSFPYMKKQHWIWALYEGSDRLNPAFNNPGEAYRFRPNWQKKLAKEEGEFCYTYGEVYKSQIPTILKKLKKKQTREAIINMWDEDYLHDYGDRTPCTLTLHFLIRNNALHLFVNMRTNDAMNLLPYDIWHHCLLQRYIAAKLGIQLGQYHHQASHMYYPKRRATSGNIDRVITEMIEHSRRAEDSPKEFYSGDDFGVTIDTDMLSHYQAISAASEGDIDGGLRFRAGIQSTFVKDLTSILIIAEGNARGYKPDIPLSLPEFNFIKQLGYHLRSR